MKVLISILLSLSFLSCSSKREAPEPTPYSPSTFDNMGGTNYCTSGGIECVAVWVLVYGSIATVRFIKESVSSLTKFTDSNPSAIVIKCHIESPNKDFARPCGPFNVDVLEKSSGKSRSYNLAGYDNQISLVKGKNKISVKLLTCGLTQVADDIKVGDVMKLEFPSDCYKE